MNGWKNVAAASAVQGEAIASFRVCVTSAEDATWQGMVETDSAKYCFKSELQLLRWVMEQFPSLRPDTVRKDHV